MANGTQTVITKYWPIIAAFTVVAVGYGTNMANLANAEDAIASQEQRIVAIEKDLGDIKTSVARSEVNQEHTTKDIQDIERMLDRILSKLDGE